MLEVICVFILYHNNDIYTRYPTRAPGVTIKSTKEQWLVDISYYIKKHPELKDYNNSVQEVDSNDCEIVK